MWKVILFLVYLIQSTYSYKILAILPFPIKSHYTIYSVIMEELVIRGHHVTVFTPFPKSGLSLTKVLGNRTTNYRQIDTSVCLKRATYSFSAEELSKINTQIWPTVYEMSSYIDDDRKLLNCEPYEQLLKSDEKYDLLIHELFISDTFLGFVDKFKIPLVALCPNVLLPWAADRIGDIDNPSYLPSFYNFKIQSTVLRDFFDRLHNVILNQILKIIFDYHFQVKSQVIAREFFGKSMPPLYEIAKRTDLMLTYSSAITNRPRPHLPNVIEIGGVHIKPPEKLDKKIRKFIENGPNGVVYFSMGSLLQGNSISKIKRDAFLNAFSKIPQKVLWKWEDESISKISDNIMISKWMPQRDILAHPNVKLFISHGGSLGVNEAVFEGVPVLGIPVYCDQKLNLLVLKENGAAEIINYDQISNETLLHHLQLLLNDIRYAENMKRLSDLFKDQPLSPMDKAIYWIEYVIRHNGTRFMRSISADMPLHQYLLLDVILFILLVTIALNLIFYFIIYIPLSRN